MPGGALRDCLALAGLLFFLLRSVSIFLRIAYTDGQTAGLQSYAQKDWPTSSRLDCFALLALRVDIPASLALDSNLGLGILLVVGLSVAKGLLPRG